MSDAQFETSIFINCPFDRDYEPILQAILFCAIYLGFSPRIATESNDSGAFRLEKIRRLIEASKFSIHDLSRCQSTKKGEHYRLNMPFELGLCMGAKRFCPSHRYDKVKIMVSEPYKLPEYLSDLGGNDPDAHHEDHHQILMIVRDFLQGARRGKPLPGSTALVAAFDRFKRAIPRIAEGIEHGAGEIGVRKNFPTFVWCLTEFLKGPKPKR